MTDAAPASNITAPAQFIETTLEKYAYRRFGNGVGTPLLCLRHFTGTLDNWDPAVTDALASGREVILFESAGLGSSTGEVPDTVLGMAAHALAFVDALGLEKLDLLGFSLGGMVAQQIALERPSLVRKMLLVATAQSLSRCIGLVSRRKTATKSWPARSLALDPSLSGPPRMFSLWSRTRENMRRQAAGDSATSKTANLPTRRCLKPAFPATSLPELTISSSPITHLSETPLDVQTLMRLQITRMSE